MQSRQGIMHFRIEGKCDKIRFLPVHASVQRLIEEYLVLPGHRDDLGGPIFRPIKNTVTGKLDRPLNPKSVYRNIVRNTGLGSALASS